MIDYWHCGSDYITRSDYQQDHAVGTGLPARIGFCESQKFTYIPPLLDFQSSISMYSTNRDVSSMMMHRGPSCRGKYLQPGYLISLRLQTANCIFDIRIQTAATHQVSIPGIVSNVSCHKR